MGYGRISVVLGVHSGLGSTIQFCEAVKKGEQNLSSQNELPIRSRLSDAEIFAVLTQLGQFDKLIRREEIQVHWSVFGATSNLELPLLAKIMDLPIETSDVLATEDIQGLQCDAVIYVPLDVQQPKQVEQLARLSMMAPRVRHVAFACVPRWNHAQLMALREIWHWIDPKQAGRIQAFGEDLIRVNGGLTRKDIAKVDLSQIKREENMDPVIITRSPRMKEVLNLVDAVADTDSTILITGDSGTGKELIAQRVHFRSHRKIQAMNAVNCGAIPSELLESELFGHIKGAFTGAVSNREGRFEAAEKGSLFLDEIAEMGPNLQVKLLRVLQTKKYEPVGSTKSRSADVRIIAATNKDLELEVKEGRFREDLFYRLNVIPIHVPGLRDRKEDIQLLVEYFIKKFNREKVRRVTGVTRASLRALVAYDWPGNVRELENLMERMVILKSSGMIDVLDFPEKYRRVSLSEIEYEDLMNAAKLTVTPNVMAGQFQSQPEEELGEDIFMKNSNTFTKGTIEQSLIGTAQASAGELIEQSRDSGVPGVESKVDIEGNISIEQAIRLIADKLTFPLEGLDFNSVVDQFENILILQALERTGWNRNRAAGLLRLNRTTLVEKLKKKQLMPPLRYEEAFLSGNA